MCHPMCHGTASPRMQTVISGGVMAQGPATSETVPDLPNADSHFPCACTIKLPGEHAMREVRPVR